MGIIRSTFLIDPQGMVKHVWPKVKVNGHVDEVLSVLTGGTPAPAKKAPAKKAAVKKAAAKKAPAKKTAARRG
jgi:peroxiredoxin Q/BCP